MPAASYSRRKTNSRRQISSDIEEDNPTQHTQDNLDDHDDDEPRRVSKSVKKEKKPNIKQRQEPQGHPNHDDQDDEDDEDDSRINVDDFHNQPLGKRDLPKLAGMSSDWSQMAKKIRQNWNVVGDVAISMADVAEEDEGEKASHLRPYRFVFLHLCFDQGPHGT
jgi:hypothetical protein